MAGTKRKSAAPPPRRSATRARPLVLLVDDNPDNREMYSEYFVSAGYRVLEASDGATAIALARKRRPTAIVMDLSMPGIDGWEATRRLKAAAETRAIPILIVSAHAEEEPKARARAAGCDLFVAKPCLPSDLADHVAQAIDGLLRTRP
jgi:CheY-like chemotaxis protein